MTELRNADPFGGREPPPSLRDRITRTLNDRGLVEPRSSRLRRQVVTVGTLVTLVVVAFGAGRWQRSSATTDSGPNFLLLLYEDSTYRDDRPVREIVAEYGGWADSLRRERRLVAGEKLGDVNVQLPPRAAATSTEHPTGLFIVRASDLVSATVLAQTSPHLRYGGRVVVHPIDR